MLIVNTIHDDYHSGCIGTKITLWLNLNGKRNRFRYSTVIKFEMKKTEVFEGILAQIHNKMVEEVTDYAILLLDAEGVILNWNKGAERIKGYSESEIVGKHFSVFYTEDDKLQRLPDTLLSQARILGRTEAHGWRVCKDGSMFWGSVSITALHDNEDRVIGFTKVTKDLTEENKRKTEISEGYERMLLFVKHAPSAIAMFDRNMCYIAASEQWINDYKLQGQQLIGKSHYEIFPEIGENWKEKHRRCMAGAIEKCDEDMFLRADGSVQWIAWDVRPWFENEGVIGGVIMLTSDITERKNAALESNKLRDILNATSTAARIGSWEMDLIKNKIMWSDVTHEIHEVEPGFEPNLETAINFYKEGDSRAKIEKAVDEAVNLGKPFDLELELVTAKGRIVWTRAIGLTDFANGQCKRLYGIFQDIDKHKRLQENLRVSEEKFRGSFEHSAIGMALVSPEGKWLKVNKRICEIVGYEEEELLVTTFQYITHPDDLDSDLENLHKLLAGDIATYAIEKRYYHKKGHIVWVLLSVSLVRDVQGNPIHFVSQIEDITDRKIAQEGVNKLNRELTAIFDSSTQVSIIGTTVDGIITHFSKGAENLLGYTAEEMVGKQTPAILHKAEEVLTRSKLLSDKFKREIKGFDVFVEYAKQGKFDSREWTYVRKDGTEFPVQLVVTSIRDDKGISGFLGIATDLTERKAVEEGMRRYTELEAKNREMEQFTYVASHDLQEPLRTVHSFANMLSLKYTDKLDEEGKMYLRYMLQSSTRMMELIKGLLYYSRIGKERVLEEVDCNDMVADVLKDLSLKINETGAEIQVETLPVIMAYPIELQVLFQNLISNALKFVALGTKPSVKIKAQQVPLGWQFSVADNGIGIADKDKEKIFIIFKRLNNSADYDGTGIGLAHCKKIVELHNGNIWVDSAPGIGSTFNFTILS